MTGWCYAPPHLLAKDGVVLPISEVRRFVGRVCVCQDVLGTCAERNLGYVSTICRLPSRRHWG